jgi:hypothetical protein
MFENIQVADLVLPNAFPDRKIKYWICGNLSLFTTTFNNKKRIQTVFRLK